MPSPIKLKSKTYRFEDQGDCILLIDPSYEAKRLKALRALRGSAPGFPDHIT